MSQYPKVRLASENTLIGQWSNRLFDIFLAPLLCLRPFQNAYCKAMNDNSADDLWTKVLKQLNITLNVSADDLARIPKKGGVIVVANHPHGAVDGMLLGSLMHRVRSDFKMIMNEATSMPGLDDSLYFVAIFGTAKDSAKKNMKIMRDAMQWLEDGHVIVVFPAGEISAINHANEKWATDNTWSTNILRLSMRTQMPIVPLFIVGQNDSFFLKSGLLHPVLRTLQVGRVSAKLIGHNMSVRVSHPIPVKLLESLPDDAARVDFVRSKTYSLFAREDKAPRVFSTSLVEVMQSDVSAAQIQAAFDLLSSISDFRVRENNTYTVLFFSQQQLLALNSEYASVFSALKDEIGRLRELTFREVGEGSGSKRDLDRFDEYYSHLTLWDKQKKCLVGAYRIAFTNEIIPKYGIEGLYTSTQFDFKPEFFQALGEAAEVSRAFIINDYQKSPVSLSMLLGSMSQVLAEAGIHSFFGVVSMSNEFQMISKKLMMEYLLKYHGHEKFAALVSAKNPPQFNLDMPNAEWQRLLNTVNSLTLQNAVISSIEDDGKSIPPLIPIYMSLTARIVAFDHDVEFNSIDGLLVINLQDAIRKNPAMVKRLIGKECFEKLPPL